MISREVRMRSNAEQGVKIRGIVEALGREVATSAEARVMLVLNDADRTMI
ncbi:3-keto-5-aminohexanoate cleavage protein [Pseudorhodobacter sp.]|nr:3-keto-5-aminohexanoate cleavage protein [Pseudorhodobacter sp.]MDN5789214.1 3-keto-5-aminohexanoate cleavage protein [Pseudorhodobacter sp.]